jgi:hypothetical protein
MARLLLTASATLLAAALLGMTGWVAGNRRDAPAPDDRDLHLARAPVAVADNGYERWTAAASAGQLLQGEAAWNRFDAFRAGKTWEPQWIADLVAANSAATDLLRAGIASSHFSFSPPAGAAAFGNRQATLFRVRALIALSGAQARILARDGRFSDALEAASLGMRAGKQLCAAEDLDLFALYMASVFQNLSLFDLEQVIRTAPLAPDSARALARLLESTRWQAEDWQRAWGREYERLIAEVDAVSAQAGPPAWPLWLLPSDYRWQRNRTTAILADLYRDQRRKSGAFCSDTGLDRRSGRPAWGIAERFAPNTTGRLVIYGVRAQGFDKFQFARCQLETRVSLVEALAAAKAYSDAEGALPERLDALVPRYLDALPIDRYDGSPLRYARAARIVYSVGDDFTDAAPAAASSSDPRAPGVSVAF